MGKHRSGKLSQIVVAQIGVKGDNRLNLTKDAV